MGTGAGAGTAGAAAAVKAAAKGADVDMADPAVGDTPTVVAATAGDQPAAKDAVGSDAAGTAPVRTPAAAGTAGGSDGRSEQTGGGSSPFPYRGAEAQSASDKKGKRAYGQSLRKGQPSSGKAGGAAAPPTTGYYPGKPPSSSPHGAPKVPRSSDGAGSQTGHEAATGVNDPAGPQTTAPTAGELARRRLEQKQAEAERLLAAAKEDAQAGYGLPRDKARASVPRWGPSRSHERASDYHWALYGAFNRLDPMWEPSEGHRRPPQGHKPSPKALYTEEEKAFIEETKRAMNKAFIEWYSVTNAMFHSATGSVYTLKDRMSVADRPLPIADDRVTSSVSLRCGLADLEALMSVLKGNGALADGRGGIGGLAVVAAAIKDLIRASEAAEKAHAAAAQLCAGLRGDVTPALVERCQSEHVKTALQNRMPVAESCALAAVAAAWAKADNLNLDGGLQGSTPAQK
jgi:hypothetical protein